MTRADGASVRDDLLTRGKKVSPNEYMTAGQTQVDTYAMTDDVTDSQFDAGA